MTPDLDCTPAGRSRGRRRGRAVISVLVTALIVTGGYTTAIALTPIPAPQRTLKVAGSKEFVVGPESAQEVVDTEVLPTAIGWLHNTDVWTNDSSVHSIASISKLVTVLVCLEQQPLTPGVDGPMYVWSDADVALQQDYLARDGIAFPIPIGTEVTHRQMLTLALLPSANDFTAAYATSIFGDNDAFITAVEDWKTRHGLASLTLVEPTGMDERNIATAAEVLQIGRLALENPTIAEFTQMPSAELPWGIGTVENTNPLLGHLPGIVGLKTGRSSSAGYNLVAAQASDASGRELVKLSVTLGRESAETRIQSSAGLLAALETLPQFVDLVEAGVEVGTTTTIDGATVSLVPAGSASTVLVPGETALRKITLTDVGVGAAGQVAGSIVVGSPTGDDEIQVVTTADIVAPGFWWRFTHPVAAFGWA